jgi:hypothetical protein
MQGGPSHLDLFDPKKELDKHDGTTFGGDIKFDNAAEASPVLMASPWKFEKRGSAGRRSRSCCPHLGRDRRRHRAHPLDETGVTTTASRSRR